MVASLIDLLRGLEVEAQAVRAVAGGSDLPRGGAGSRRNRYGLGAAEVAGAETMLAVCAAMRTQLAADPAPVSACLRVLHDQEDGDDSSSMGAASNGVNPSQQHRASTDLSRDSVSSVASSMSGSADAAMVQKAVGRRRPTSVPPSLARPLPCVFERHVPASCAITRLLTYRR